MKLMVSGHRTEKLEKYDTEWIKMELCELVKKAQEEGFSFGLSGMASGVDLWFCNACLLYCIPYTACIPFDGQELCMSNEDGLLRREYIRSADLIKKVKNRYMVDVCSGAIVVWDGNKGGTHNVFQQLVEAKKDFWWMNPVKQVSIKV